MTAMRVSVESAQPVTARAQPAARAIAAVTAAAPGAGVTRADIYARHRKPLGDPAPLACTVAKAALETVLGATSIDSLVRWLTPEVRHSLAQQHSLARRAGKTSAPPVAIRRARVCRVSSRAAEVSIVAYCDGRARAIAMRLEDAAGRWLVTTIEVG
ncbi:Rv3235 family protein [Demequina aurantiaca]|uniref:Rv3235 family protein n=1 Tax=Demequina aurantiaca TaxID=676200 RepID=UPI000A58C105|nr:Rv3235 family protein [Demequina aurantiaca]